MIRNEILCNNDWTKYAKYCTIDIGHSSKKSLKYNNNFNKKKTRKSKLNNNKINNMRRYSGICQLFHEVKLVVYNSSHVNKKEY